MVIVNPYLKKKKPLSGGSGASGSGRARPPSIPHVPNKHKAHAASSRGTSQAPPPRVTPNGKKTVPVAAANRTKTETSANPKASPSPLAYNKNAANRPRVSPQTSSTKVERKISDSSRGSNSAGGNGGRSSPPQRKAAPYRAGSSSRSSKTKLTVKQRLKQEIAALKKQKQLQKLQKEAEERRRRRLAEQKAEEERKTALLAEKEKVKQQKQAERERLARLKEEERTRKQLERERKQREKELERERKQKEKLKKEEEKRLRLEQKMEEQKQKAEAKYQRDLLIWKIHQQRWMEQQQRIHYFQQQQLLQQRQTHHPSHNQYQFFPNQQRQQLYQYEGQHHQQNQNQHQYKIEKFSAGKSPLFPRTPTQSLPKGESVEDPNHRTVVETKPCVPVDTIPGQKVSCQSTHSTSSEPISPLDSPTALAIDSLLRSELMSPKRLAASDASRGGETSPLSVKYTEADANRDDKRDEPCSEGVDMNALSVSTNLSKAPQPEESVSAECRHGSGINSNKTGVDPTTAGGVGSPSPSSIQNQDVEPKNSSLAPMESGIDHSTALREQRSTGVAPNTVSSSSASLTTGDTLCQSPLESSAIQSPPMTWSQQSCPMLTPQGIAQKPPIYHQSSLDRSSSYGSHFPYSGMPTRDPAPFSNWKSMVVNTAFSNENYGPLGSFAWIPPPPPPPQRPVLQQTKARCRTTSVTRRPKTPKPIQVPMLCKPMEAPSPFANQGRHLVTILVVRDPRTEKSFGVNLKIHTESALVDREWIDAQQKSKARKPKPDETGSTIINTKPEVMGASVPKKSLEVVPKTHQPPLIHTSGQSKQLTGKLLPPKTDTILSSAVHAKREPKANGDDQDKTFMASMCHNAEIKTAIARNHTLIRADKEKKEPIQTTCSVTPTKNEMPTNLNSNANIDCGKSDSNDIRAVIKNCVEFLVSSVESSQKEADKQTVSMDTRNIVQKRKRRRRVNFSVMMVTDAEKQNSRRPDVDSKEKLRSGDIVVTIQGHKLDGMSFRDACVVFSREAESMNDSLIQTRVVVARKPEMTAPVNTLSADTSNSVTLNPVVTSLSSSTPSAPLPPPENTSMVFSPEELATLSNCFLNILNSSKRILGQDIQDSSWQLHSLIFRMGSALEDTGLTPRGITTLTNKWGDLTRLIDYELVEKGKNHWTKKFRQEFGNEKLPFSSDVERNAMRHLPRPLKGCRCKKKDHEYVSDPKCILYRDLQQRLSKEELKELRLHTKNKFIPKKSKDLNAVESAFKNRMLKLKNATENESIEARFVDKMEEIQVKELHQAVFAPNLTTIVLSTIFELQREFHVSVVEEDKDEDMNYNANEEQEDDVPLECLGKRGSDVQSAADTRKQQKVDGGGPNFCMEYLVRMLNYVSKTWGHCYREPNTDEYAWRWELFHAVHSDHDQWEAHATNPRVPDSFPFENVRFGLNSSKSTDNKLSSFPKTIRQFEDSILSNAPLALDVPNKTLEQFSIAVHLLSPARSGLYDELIALLKMGIIQVSASGIPILTGDWWTKIDIVVLDDMLCSWSTKADPDSRYCVNEELRDTLEEQWVKSDYGWALLENPKELIFDFTVLDEWRETFEGRLEEKANLSEGIGLFGL